MANKSVELYAEQKFIDEAIKDGRCTLQEVSMRAIGEPDPAFQARLISINMDHVAILDAARRLEGSLAPIVCFRLVDEKDRIVIVNGFHRWKVSSIARDESIRAYLIDGTTIQAKEYAVMCNRINALPRTKEDIKKGVLMLLGDATWFTRSSAVIGSHVGVSPEKVTLYRAEYCEARRIPIPVMVIGTDGKERKATARFEPRHLMKKAPRGTENPEHYIHYKGRQLYLGRDPVVAEQRRDEILDAHAVQRASCAVGPMAIFLARRGVASSPCVSVKQWYPGISGCISKGAVWSGPRKSVPDWGSEFVERVGSVLMTRQAQGDPSMRTVIVCYREDVPSKLAELAEGLGIELLTPEQLADSLAGTEENGSGDSQIHP